MFLLAGVPIIDGLCCNISIACPTYWADWTTVQGAESAASSVEPATEQLPCNELETNRPTSSLVASMTGNGSAGSQAVIHPSLASAEEGMF